MIPRVIFLLTICCLLSFNFGLEQGSAVFAAQEFFPFLGEITANKVNVRAGQSVNFEKLCSLEAGDQVIVIEKNFSWYKIRLPECAESYVSAKYVQLLGGDLGEIAGDRVNVRSQSNTDCSVIGQLVRGNKIIFLEERQRFYKIYPPKSSFGWISSKFIAFKSNNTAALEKDVVGEREKKIVLKKQKEAENLQQLKRKVTILGTVELQNNIELDGLRYKLVADDSLIYCLGGFNDVLDEFIGFKVKVEGTIDPHAPKAVFYPLINISKIQLEF